VVVANAADPLVVWSAQTADQVVWVDTALLWSADSALCPACGAVLRRVPNGCSPDGSDISKETHQITQTHTNQQETARDDRTDDDPRDTRPGTFPNASRWDCPACPLTQPEATYSVLGPQILLPDGRLIDPQLRVPGSFNISNAAMALAAAAAFGVET
jgi:hypothetical protein